MITITGHIFTEVHVHFSHFIIWRVIQNLRETILPSTKKWINVMLNLTTLYIYMFLLLWINF